MKCTLSNSTKQEFNVSQLTVAFYRKQVWVSVAADAAHVISKTPLTLGTYSLNIDNVSLTCSVIQSQQIDNETCYCWLRGCVGDITKLPSEKQLIGPTFGQVVRYLASQSGTNISSESDNDIMSNRSIGQTYTINNTVSVWRQLRTVCDKINCSCSSTLDGSIIIKRNNNNTPFIPPKEYVQLPNTSEGATQFWVEELKVIPICGQKLNDQVIERITLSVNQNGTQVSCYFTDNTDNILGPIQSQIKNIRSYRAQVITQLNDWSLKVRIVDKVQGIPELAIARIRYGSPLLTSRVMPGTLVSLHLDSAGEIYVDGFESKYTEQAFPDEYETLYVGSPQEARNVARTSDGVISYFPNTFTMRFGLLPIPIYASPTGNIPGTTPVLGYIDPLITPITITPMTSLTPALPAGTITIPGIIKTGSRKIKAE